MEVIGIDIGTTSISGTCLDISDNIVKESLTVPNKSFISVDNSYEKIQDPKIIIDTATKLLEDLLSKTKNPAVIGLTGQMHGILYLDKDGNAISPLYTWQDTRGNIKKDGLSVCEYLSETYNKPFYTGYGLVTHVYNVKNNLVPSAAVKVCTIMDYLGMVLTGRQIPLVHTSNAASLGFYDIKNSCFEIDILEKEGVDKNILPEITSDIAVLGAYNGIPITIAIGDNQASFMGSIKNGRDEILVNLGTGGQISKFSDEIIIGEDIETRPLIGDGYIVAGSTLCGGRAYALLADFFTACAKGYGIDNVDTYSMMDQLLSSHNPEEPLDIKTTFNGTRDYPDKTGEIKNLTINNFTPADFTYGVLMGIVGEMYERYEIMLRGSGPNPTKMIGSGNGIRKNIHLQKLMANRFGMELVLSSLNEEAACGAAISGYTAVSGTTWRQSIGV